MNHEDTETHGGEANFGEAHLAADAVVALKSYSGVADQPVRSDKDTSRHFLNVASTPPHEVQLSKLGTIFKKANSPPRGDARKGNSLFSN